MTVGIIAALVVLFIVSMILSVLVITTNITLEVINCHLEGAAVTTFCIVTAIHYAREVYTLKAN